jgi:uncharacterized protein YecE (DUF72 family)
MKFGKLDDISDVDWSLPANDPSAFSFLQPVSGVLEIFYGAPAWAHPEWLGKIYPTGTPRTKFLNVYSQTFTCIELNTTHYRIPTADQTKKWVEQVVPGFIFCPKVHQDISHARNGLLDFKLSQVWLDFLRALGPHRGPSFLQLPPHFSYEQKAELFSFLKIWPDEFELAIEFRHPSWFENGGILPALVSYLRGRKIGLVITDVAGRRDLLHVAVSAEFSLLRFVGNDLDASDFSRAEAWAARFEKWREQGLRRLYLFIHEPDDISVPEMTRFFLERLRAAGPWKMELRLQAPPQLGLGLEPEIRRI